MLRSLGVPVKVSTELCMDNLGMIMSCTNTDSELKTKYVDIYYQKFQESVADGIVNTLKVCTTVNRADILTNGVYVGTLVSLSDESYRVDWGDK